MVAQKKIHAPEMMSDQFELTKLGGQNIKLGLGKFLALKKKGYLEPLL
jgi:hypothetical protein